MFKYTPHFIPMNVFVIGAGGTGGRLIPLLAQFLKTLGNYVINPSIHVVDHDIIEEKNLLRQNFVAADVGKPKALVMANRYSKAFNINVIGYQNKIEELNPEEMMGGRYPALVVMCVDNMEARFNTIKAFKQINSRHNVFYIDSGNENDFGQLTMFTPHMWYSSFDKHQVNIDDNIPIQVPINHMPLNAPEYYTIKDSAAPSCAELDQTLAINAMMATAIMAQIQNFYYGKTFNYNKVFVNLNGVGRVNFLNPFYLKYISEEVGSKNLYTGFNIADSLSPICFEACNLDEHLEMALGQLREWEREQALAAAPVETQSETITETEAPEEDEVIG